MSYLLSANLQQFQEKQVQLTDALVDRALGLEYRAKYVIDIKNPAMSRIFYALL